MRFILSVLLLALSAFALNETFVTPWIVWKNPEILIAFTDNVHSPINPDDFCRSLARTEPSLGKPECRLAGDWERDSLSGAYLHWLGMNVDARVESRHLAARSSQVAERLHKLDDRYLIILSEHHDTLWAMMFSGNRSFEQPRIVNEPAALVSIFPKPADAATFAEVIGLSWFAESPIRKLTDHEKEAAAVAPDPSYAATPAFDYWISMGTGWSQAAPPLTPNSWYKSRVKDHVVHYRSVKDSLSAWSFLDDKSQLFTLRGGFTWIGFVGIEAYATRTNYRVKIDPTDSLYRELDHWSFARYEMGLTAHITMQKKLNESFSLNPYAFLGFDYSFFVESIGLRPDFTASEQYKNRFQFESYYRGAIFGVGNRLTFKENYALDTRVGIASRGKSLDQTPSPDAAPSPTIIGGTTIDCFASVALEYHWIVH